MESLRCESSTFAREEEQKSNDSLTAATSFSLASVSLSFAVCGAATPEIFEQKRLLDSAMCKARCAKVIWSPVGLKENFSGGVAWAGGGVMFLEEGVSPRRSASLTGLPEEGAGV